MRKSTILIVGAALAAGAFGGAGAQNKGTIKIASQSPLSGPQSNLGEAIKNGIEMAVKDCGEGIRSAGFRLVYQPEDDQAQANVGVANANRLINDADLLAIVGHLNSGVALPSGDVYHKAGLLSVSPANTNPRLTERNYNTFVRIVGRDDVQGPAAAQYLVNEVKAKTFVVINDKTSYGQGIADAFEGEVKKLGGQVVFSTGVDEKETDFSSILNRVAVLKPDVVYYGGIYSQGGPLLKQMRDKGISAVFVGGDGLDSSEIERLAGKANLNGVIFTTTAVPLDQFKAGEKFAADYKKAYNKNAESYSVYGYDAACVALKGIEAAIKANSGNKPSRAQVADAVRKITYEGLTGRIKFNAKGDLETAKYVVLRVGNDGYSNAKIVKVLDVKAP